jgi:hypothetical protein
MMDVFTVIGIVSTLVFSLIGMTVVIGGFIKYLKG